MNCLRILLNSRSYQLIKCPSFYPKLLLCPIHIQFRGQSTQEPKITEKSDKSGLNLDLTANRMGDQPVYAGPDNVIKMIKMIKKFSISTTLIAAGIQPFIFQQIVATNSSSFAIGFAGMTSAGIVLSPLLLNWLTKRYVTHLYYDYETKVFTAWYLNLLCRRVSTQYRATDVSVPETLGMFTTYTVGQKKRPFFVDPEFVTDFNAYKMMLGYDKPLDIKLNKILGSDQQNTDKIK